MKCSACSVLWVVAAALFAVLATTGANSSFAPADRDEGLCASKLGAFVDALLERPENRRALHGILVGKVSSGKEAPLYARNAASLFTPASNTKLFTTASLFQHTSGAEHFRYATPFLFRRSTSQLCVRGGGDPSLAHADLVGAAAGIKNSVGKVSELVVDNSLFRGDGQPFPSSWEWDDLNWDYGAEPEALVVEENAITFTLSPGQKAGQPLSLQFSIADDRDTIELRNAGVTLPAGAAGNVTVYYPPGNAYLQVDGGLPVGAKPSTFATGVINSTSRFANLFRNVLKSQGVAVDRIVFDKCSGDDWTVVYTHYSKHLAVLMDRCLQISDNLYAEVFARTLGAFFTPANQTSGSTLNDGLGLIAKTLKDLGAEPASFAQVDGSGLSRHNMLSPESLAHLLNGMQMMNSPTSFKLFRSFLPLAGKSGSLINRFKGTPAEGKVWAKTGSMTGVSSLSGYAENPNFPHQTVIFSIIVNGNSLGQAVARTVIDQIVEALVELRDC